MTGAGSAPSTELVSIVVPMITLVAIFAIDSVEPEDDIYYRAFVGGCSVFSIIPAVVILLETPIQHILNIQLDSHLEYLLLSAAGVTLLVIGSTVTEVSRGLEDDRNEVLKVMAAICAATAASFLIMGLI